MGSKGYKKATLRSTTEVSVVIGFAQVVLVNVEEERVELLDLTVISEPEDDED